MEREVFHQPQQPEQEHVADANGLLRTMSLEVQAYVRLCHEAEDPTLSKLERKGRHDQMRQYFNTMLQTPNHAEQYREELSRWAAEKYLERAQEEKRKA